MLYLPLRHISVKPFFLDFFVGIAGDNDPSDQYMSPSVLRSRQDAAYRSVAALQLRVEELTLEVTKV